MLRAEQLVEQTVEAPVIIMCPEMLNGKVSHWPISITLSKFYPQACLTKAYDVTMIS